MCFLSLLINSNSVFLVENSKMDPILLVAARIYIAGKWEVLEPLLTLDCFNKLWAIACMTEGAILN